ncbi:hypothetical protein ACWATR_33785 [Nostoc sp. UIC 10890]
MILPECGRDGLRPAGGDRSSNNVAIASGGRLRHRTAVRLASDSWTDAWSGVKHPTEIVELFYLLLDFIICC